MTSADHAQFTRQPWPPTAAREHGDRMWSEDPRLRQYSADVANALILVALMGMTLTLLLGLIL